MTAAHRLELPWPPSVGHYKTPMRNRMILTTEAREYQRRAAVYILLRGRSPEWPISTPVAVEVLACQPDRRRRDLDNLPKMVYDQLVHSGVLVDDSLIHRQAWEWGPVAPGGRILVRLGPHSPPCWESWAAEFGATAPR